MFFRILPFIFLAVILCACGKTPETLEGADPVTGAVLSELNVMHSPNGNSLKITGYLKTQDFIEPIYFAGQRRHGAILMNPASRDSTEIQCADIACNSFSFPIVLTRLKLSSNAEVEVRPILNYETQFSDASSTTFLNTLWPRFITSGINLPQSSITITRVANKKVFGAYLYRNTQEWIFLSGSNRIGSEVRATAQYNTDSGGRWETTTADFVFAGEEFGLRIMRLPQKDLLLRF